MIGSTQRACTVARSAGTNSSGPAARALTELALVEAGAAVTSDRPQRPSRTRPGDDGTCGGCSRKIRVLDRDDEVQGRAQSRVDREAVLGEADRRGEHGVEVESAVTFVEGEPAVDRARHGHRPDVVLHRYGHESLGPGCLGVGARAGHARGIERLRRAVGVVHERPEIATHAAHVRARHRQHGIRGDRASTAEPPLRSTSTPASVARWSIVETIALAAWRVTTGGSMRRASRRRGINRVPSVFSSS